VTQVVCASGMGLSLSPTQPDRKYDMGSGEWFCHRIWFTSSGGQKDLGLNGETIQGWTQKRLKPEQVY
jgi:hypothetical protein